MAELEYVPSVQLQTLSPFSLRLVCHGDSQSSGKGYSHLTAFHAYWEPLTTVIQILRAICIFESLGSRTATSISGDLWFSE